MSNPQLQLHCFDGGNDFPCRLDLFDAGNMLSWCSGESGETRSAEIRLLLLCSIFNESLCEYGGIRFLDNFQPAFNVDGNSIF